MTSPIKKKIEPVKPAAKGNSKGSQKMFFHETEDEYEQSKMVPYESLGNIGIKEGNLSISKGMISGSIPARSMSQKKNMYENDGMSESGQQQNFSDEWSQQESEISDVLELDYQLLRLETVIQNSLEQFVNVECILQPNILHDIGRLRFILIHFVQETIKKSVDDNGQFDIDTFCDLMDNFKTIEHFLYLEYPILAMEYDQQQEVAKYELMSDQQFSDEYYFLLSPEEINKFVELAQIQQVLQQDYQQALSRNHYYRNYREDTQGPLDSLVSNKQHLFSQLGKLSSNPPKNPKKQQQFKVNIRKQQPQQKKQTKKSTPLKSQQQKQTKSEFKLFNLNPISIDQPSTTNSQSQANSNKNLTYQQFVTMLEKQKQQHLQNQNKSKQRQKQKEKQRKESQQKKKKSHFDQILGRKDDQQSKNYLKPFIGEFKKNQSENQLRELLGLNDGHTPKKQQTQMVEQSTPQFKSKLTTNQMQRGNSQSNTNIFGKALQSNLRNAQNSSVRSFQNKQTNKNTQLIANKNQPNFLNNTNLPSTGPTQNRFVSQNPITQSNISQNSQSMSPASVSPPNLQTNDGSKNFQNIQQVSQKQTTFPISPIQGSMNLPQNPFFRNNVPNQHIHVNAGHSNLLSSNIQQPSTFNNQISRQNNLMPQFKSNTNQNPASNKFENLNSRNQPLIPSINSQIPSSQMFSNLQMNQNINNKSSSNPYLRGQNRNNNTNNMPVIGSNSVVAGHQPQYSQETSQQLIQKNNLSQTICYNLPNQNNIPPNISSQNLNQKFTPQTNIAKVLPTPSLNGFLGSQKIINPGLINLPVGNSQPIRSQNIQPSFLPTQKMNAQENQKKSRSNSKQLKNLTRNQQQKSSSSKLQTTQRTFKENTYDPQVLDNMKLKDFINIFCQEELKKDYSDLYSELLLLKKWKILDFRIDSLLYQKFRYLSYFKTKGLNTLGVQNKNDLKRRKYEEIKKGKTSFEDPFPLMMILHKKIEQINQQSLFDMYQRQKCLEIPSPFKTNKTTNFEYALNEFNKIQQVQNLLEKKISLLEKELDISSSNIKQQANLDAYLNMNDQLSTLILLAQNVEKWMINSGFCQEKINKKQQGLQIQHRINQKKFVDFNLLYQLYANINQIDQELDIMSEKVQKFKQ